MPTIFSHALGAVAILKTLKSEPRTTRFWVLTAICAMLPDADVIGMAFGTGFESILGHRGITHSIVFALVTGALVAWLFFRRNSTLKFWLYFSLATLTHPLLDMFTDGGPGVALLAPFSEERFFFPWRPIKVSPIGLRFFSERGLAVVVSEFIFIWLPGLVLLIASWLLRKRSKIPQANISSP